MTQCGLRLDSSPIASRHAIIYADATWATVKRDQEVMWTSKKKLQTLDSRDFKWSLYTIIEFWLVGSKPVLSKLLNQ